MPPRSARRFEVTVAAERTGAAGASWQAAGAGLVAAVVGFASSFAVVLNGLTSVGASPAQAASGLMAASIAMGLCAIVLSLKLRLPIAIAWSTPGAALLASTAVEGGFPAAVGAFITAGVLVVLAGLWKPLGRAVAAIPAPLANAMLAGVLLGLCLAPVKAVAQDPLPALAIIGVWAVVGRIKKIFAVPAAALATVAILVATSGGGSLSAESLLPQPVFVVPVFSFAATVGVAVPLFIVTMASQNIPGYAVMNAHGYKPDFNALLRSTGLFSIAAAPFGGHAVNLAAITAALCASPDAHPDPARRWWASTVAGIAYVAFGLAAGGAAAFVASTKPILIEAVAGLALLGALGGALQGATAQSETREPAVVTFVVAASGLTLFGIGGAFWGLTAGGAMMALDRVRRQRPMK